MYEGSGEALLVPEPEEAKRSKPYHKEAFRYEAAGDCYRCPQGQVLSFVGTEWHKTGQEVRVYRLQGSSAGRVRPSGSAPGAGGGDGSGWGPLKNCSTGTGNG